MSKERKHGQFAIIPARTLDDIRFDDNPRHLYALLILGTYADRDGWCYPGLKTIAERLCVSTATVSNTMKELSEWGYLHIVRSLGKKGEANTSNRYRVLHDSDLPIQFDRTEIEHPIKFARAKSKDHHKSASMETYTNAPSNAPIECGDSKTESPPPSFQEKEPDAPVVVESKKRIAQAMSEFTAEQAHKSDPKAEERAYVKTAATIFSMILNRDGLIISEDRVAAKKLFHLHIPIQFIQSKEEPYRNGEGQDFRKQDATAFWIKNRIERDYALVKTEEKNAKQFSPNVSTVEEHLASVRASFIENGLTEADYQLWRSSPEGMRVSN